MPARSATRPARPYQVYSPVFFGTRFYLFFRLIEPHAVLPFGGMVCRRQFNNFDCQDSSDNLYKKSLHMILACRAPRNSPY
jgi:hypothetical protein